ncbi:DsbA family protein [Aerococcaceae bacterium 50-4]
MAQKITQTNNSKKLSPSACKLNHVFEVFLFVNPLGDTCLNCEEEVLKFVQQTDKKVYFRFITTSDMQTFNNYIKALNKPLSLSERNALYLAHQEVCKGYKAALLQGKKVGREYLMRIQDYFGRQGNPYSHEKMLEIAHSTRLDTDMWLQDLESELTKESIISDAKLARQMQIAANPTVVIFDNINYKYGFKIEENITLENLEYLTDKMMVQSEEAVTQDNNLRPKLTCIKK